MAETLWASMGAPPRDFTVTLPGMTLQGQGVVDNTAPVSAVFSDLKGWWDPPPSTGTVTQRAYQHGGWLNRAFYSPRVLVLEGAIFGDDPLMVRDAFEAFVGGLSINDLFPLVVNEGGLVRHVMVRMEEDPLIVWNGGEAATFNIQLIAPDHRRLSGDGTSPTYSVTVGLPFTEGGWILPVTLPATIEATVVSGSVSVRSVGSAPAPVTVTFTGPVSRPSVRSAVTGQSMLFDLDVLAGQSLVVDLDARTVLLNGVRRRNTMRGQWLEPVPNDVLVFDSAAYNPDARMTVSWFDSWK